MEKRNKLKKKTYDNLRLKNEIENKLNFIKGL